MISDNTWDLDQESVVRAINEWRAREDPGRDLRMRVGDWLLDRLRYKPLMTGHAELVEGDAHVRFARVVGTNVGVLFVVDLKRQDVSVATISGM